MNLGEYYGQREGISNLTRTESLTEVTGEIFKKNSFSLLSIRVDIIVLVILLSISPCERSNILPNQTEMNS
jgi:hypothetical protein